MSTGIVLEGGAMRAIFTAGVLDVLMENNIFLDGVVGVSAGAAFGSNYKSGQIERTIRYNLKYAKDIRYSSFWSLLFTGNLYGAKFCYHTLPEKLDVFDKEAFNKNPMEFYAVCTDVLTGAPVYKKCDVADGKTFEYIRASASLPLVSKTVKIDGKLLLDGGISDSIPVKFALEKYQKCVVVLTQPYGYLKHKSSMMGLIKLLYKKYPKIVEAVKNRHIMYNKTVEYINSLEKEGKIFVIRPCDTLPIKRMCKDKEKLKETYNIGRNEALKRLEDLKVYLNEA